jgi:hypothetical protein
MLLFRLTNALHIYIYLNDFYIVSPYDIKIHFYYIYICVCVCVCACFEH